MARLASVSHYWGKSCIGPNRTYLIILQQNHSLGEFRVTSRQDTWATARLVGEGEAKSQYLDRVPVLGLDALASTGYGPEAALTILVPLGLAGLKYFPIIAVFILIELTTLYLSYRQTAAAYPGGGGAYIVASDNLGTYPGVVAAVMLLLDYLLNVCVGISAGIGAVVSAFPALHPYTLSLCLLVLITLTLLNLHAAFANRVRPSLSR